MGNRRSVLGGSDKTSLPDPGNNGSDKSKRLSKLNGSVVHAGIKRNRTEMGEIAKVVANTLGWITLVSGFLANLDNVLSVLLGCVALGFGIFKALDQREAWLIKRADRKDKYGTKN